MIITCPKCAFSFDVNIGRLLGSRSTPAKRAAASRNAKLRWKNHKKKNHKKKKGENGK